MKIRNGLRAKTREEVAAEYGVTSRTLYNWIKSQGINLPRGIIKPIHLNNFIQHLEIRSTEMSRFNLLKIRLNNIEDKNRADYYT